MDIRKKQVEEISLGIREHLKKALRTNTPFTLMIGGFDLIFDPKTGILSLNHFGNSETLETFTDSNNFEELEKAISEQILNQRMKG